MHTPGEQPGREPRLLPSKRSPARRCTGARSHPTALPSDQSFATPAPRERAEDWRTAGGSPGLGAHSTRPAQGAHRGVAGRKDAGAGRGGASGGGGPCPNSHSPPRSPPGPGSAALPAPVPAARVSSRDSDTGQGAQRWGEEGASRGSVASKNEGVGKVGR